METDLHVCETVSIGCGSHLHVCGTVSIGCGSHFSQLQDAFSRFIFSLRGQIGRNSPRHSSRAAGKLKMHRIEKVSSCLVDLLFTQIAIELSLQRSVELRSSSVATRHSSNKFGSALAAPSVEHECNAFTWRCIYFASCFY